MLWKLGIVVLAILALVAGVVYWKWDDFSFVGTGPAPPADRTLGRMQPLAGGRFRMGNDQSSRPAERPAHFVTLGPFRIDEHEVTNGQFAEFVSKTGYVTTAERRGRSMVFDMKAEKWKQASGADWRHPGGPDTSIDGRDNFPVVHVSWYDARAYAQWSGKRLPTEAEWEYAARGGLRDADYPWGRDELIDGKYQANSWQRDKPPGADGFAGLAPVKSFPPNRYGLYDMAGNVWEWCNDWHADDYYSAGPEENPPGPEKGEKKVIRGGSWLCPEDYFVGYTVFARAARDPEETTQHIGFRCVKQGENR
jgi:formylglycine-generating enzyme required for sulfatase activity